MEDPVGVIDPIEEAVDLRAEFALRVGMIGVAAQLHSPILTIRSFFDGHDPPAGVRAIVMTGAEDDASSA